MKSVWIPYNLLSEESTDYSINPDKLFEICHIVPNTRAPKDKKYIGGK